MCALNNVFGLFKRTNLANRNDVFGLTHREVTVSTSNTQGEKKAIRVAVHS